MCRYSSNVFYLSPRLYWIATFPCSANGKNSLEEQIISFLRQAEAGMPIKELGRKHGFSDASFYKWRSNRLLSVGSSIALCLKVLSPITLSAHFCSMLLSCLAAAMKNDSTHSTPSSSMCLRQRIRLNGSTRN